jgi:hypothetical protein
MGVLTGAGVRILLVGTGQHAAGSELPELPTVSATVTDLATAFVECCRARPERVRVLLDPASPLEFGRELTAAAAEAEDVLLVCYVGHGLLDARGSCTWQLRPPSTCVTGWAIRRCRMRRCARSWPISGCGR